MRSTPNTALRAARTARLMSQDDLARALREVGCVSATKRLVQRWESGVTAYPRPSHAQALERVMKLPIESLGFGAVRAGRGIGGLNDNSRDVESPIGTFDSTPAAAARVNGDHSGVWLSRYEYYSTGRDATFTVAHYAVVLHHDTQITVRSLPGSSPSVTEMDLSVDGNIATGTWSERTAVDGYYRGARYHGAVQLLVDPTGNRMAGKWIGFGKDFEINSGPWELVLQEASTSKSTLDAYQRPVPSER
ncbi:helix-turn-helix transcriptional regulator [Nocardia cyriacigeorgica]|uniref:helix-turn-helix domain-containing protein n=1 Tax=Nocardia cyriacigeorgica TaxID=135487 RepID=UPI0018941CD2|nr:helix-turn-helix transcriptional regulator [Nocardia cyriacigeorgica]MBF6343267.1 helix-turn-helix transcriptional regulator [Nocardia cyriacigeorgica]